MCILAAGDACEYAARRTGGVELRSHIPDDKAAEGVPYE